MSTTAAPVLTDEMFSTLMRDGSDPRLTPTASVLHAALCVLLGVPIAPAVTRAAGP